MLKPHTIITSCTIKFNLIERLKILFGWQLKAVVHVHVDRKCLEIKKQKKIAYVFNPRSKKETTTTPAEPKQTLRIVKHNTEN